MTPDEAPAPEQDQPIEDAPSEDQASNQEPEQPEEAQPEASEQEDSFYEFDPALPDDMDPREWATKRHKEMQAAFTQKRQADAEARKQAENDAQQYKLVIEAASDPDHPQHADALRALRIEQDQDPDEDFDDDPIETLQEQFNRLEQSLQTRDQEAQQEALEEAELEFIDDKITEVETREGRELSDEEAQIVYTLAVNNRKQDGEPDVAGAFEALTGVLRQQASNYAQSKRAPRSIANGPAARKQFDIRNDSDRLEAAAAAAEAAMQGAAG